MPTRTDTILDPFAGLVETSTRVISASAELYSEVLRTQAEAAREFIEAYGGLGGEAVRTGARTTERAEEAVAEVARGTGQAARRATRRTATATRTAARRTRRAAARPAKAAKAAPAPAPIAGYDDLTAEEILAKLPEQPQTTLAQIAAYEQANAQRATVLERVAALTGPEPAPGYDELTADDAQKLLTGGDAALAAAVRDYERRHKARTSVLEAAARHAEQSS
jgi:hypothetical protein